MHVKSENTGPRVQCCPVHISTLDGLKNLRAFCVLKIKIVMRKLVHLHWTSGPGSYASHSQMTVHYKYQS